MGFYFHNSGIIAMLGRFNQSLSIFNVVESFTVFSTYYLQALSFACPSVDHIPNHNLHVCVCICGWYMFTIFLCLCVCRNAAEVMDSSGWDNLVRNHPSLVADAFKALAQSVVPRKRPRLLSDPSSQLSSSTTSTTTTTTSAAASLGNTPH